MHSWEGSHMVFNISLVHAHTEEQSETCRLVGYQLCSSTSQPKSEMTNASKACLTRRIALNCDGSMRDTCLLETVSAGTDKILA